LATLAEKKEDAKPDQKAAGSHGGNYDHREKKRLNDAINFNLTSIEGIREDQKRANDESIAILEELQVQSVSFENLKSEFNFVKTKFSP
jgi:hypothetical protein